MSQTIVISIKQNNHHMRKINKIVIQDRESDQSARNKPKRTFKRLDLSQAKLMERLGTLRNYDMWRKTKAKRIQIQDISQEHQSPLIQVAVVCGNKNGKNQVLLQFLKEEGFFRPKHNVQGQMNAFQKILKEHAQRTQTNLKTKTIFTDDQCKKKNQNEQIKVIVAAVNENNTKGDQPRAKTEPKLQAFVNQQNDDELIQIPKQLTKLNSMIKHLPSVIRTKRNSKQNKQLNNPEVAGQLNTYLTDAEPLQLLNSLRNKLKDKKDNQVLCEDQKYMKNSKQYFFKSINSIVNKSTLLLEQQHCQIKNTNNCSKAKTQPSQLINYSKTQNLRNKKQFPRTQYWPMYSKYTIRDQDKQKTSKITKCYADFIDSNQEYSQDVRQMIQIMKKSMEKQQKNIQNQIIYDEKNSFQHRFRYKMNMQRQNYEKNVKQLLNCKRQFRIERQREQVRANGIKRFKKNKPQQKMKKMVEENTDETI